MGDRRLGKTVGLATGFALILCGSALAFFNLDPSFGGDGFVRTDGPAASADEINEIEILENAKVLAGGRMSTAAGGRDFAVARYEADGSLDLTFGGGDGIVTTDVGGASREETFGMAVQDNGKIVLAGWTRPNAPGADLDVAVVRYSADGVLDDTFDGDSGTGNGVVVVPVSGALDDSANDVVVDSEDRIVLGGEVVTLLTDTEFETDSVALRLTPTGALDDSFGGDGEVTVDYDEEDAFFATGLTDDGDPVFGGTAFDQTLSDRVWTFTRLKAADGGLDEDFDGEGSGNGMVTVPNLDGALRDMVVSPGKITGIGTPGWTLVRIEQATGEQDPTFSGDGDGDGIVTTTFATGSGFPEAITVDGADYVVSGELSGFDSSDRTLVARHNADGALDTELAPDGWFERDVVKASPTVSGSESASGLGVVDDGNAGTDNAVVVGGEGWFGEEVASTDFWLLKLGPDETAPAITITSPKQGKTRKKRVALRFTADEDATFRCRLDSKPFIEDCQSGRSFRLSLGRHVLTVEATDPTGNVATAKRRVRRVRRR
jgi:uncharacterized delta-60 repeat protein